MKKSLFLFLALFLSLSNHLHSQAYYEEDNENKNSLGFAAGASNGFGFSYQYKFNSKWNMQLTVAPFFNSDGGSTFSLGLGVDRTLRSFRKADVIYYLSNHYFHSKSKNDDFSNDDKYDVNEENITGTGGGIRFKFNEYLQMDLRIGLALYNDLDDDSYSTNLDAGFGFFFRF